MSKLSKLFPNGFIKLPSWFNSEQKQFILRALSDYETLIEENQHLTNDREGAINLMGPSWQHAANKEPDIMTRYVLMAENQFKIKNEEIERLTAMATKQAARANELYEALDNLLELVDSCEGLAGINRSQYIIEPNELSAVLEAKEVLDKSRIEAEQDNG